MKKYASIFLLLIIFEASADSGPVLDFSRMVRGGEEIYKSQDYEECMIIKIEGDFDNDGDHDFLLSTRCPYGDYGGWGNAGGTWQVYFNRVGGYKNTQSIFFHPLAFRISATGKSEEFKVEYYHRMNCCEGNFISEIIGFDRREIISNQIYKDVNVKGSDGYNRYEILFGNEYFLKPKFCSIKNIESRQCKWKDGYY